MGNTKSNLLVYFKVEAVKFIHDMLPEDVILDDEPI